MGFRPAISPISPGRDNSWIYAFNYAAAHHLDWGRDFISTFGPYGYLLFTLDLDGFVARRLGAELALAVLSGAAAALYVETVVPTVRLAGRIGLAVFLTYALAMHFTEYRWFGLFVLLALIGLRRDGPAGLSVHAAAGLLAGFSLLIKFSIGFGGVVSLAVCSLLVPRLTSAAWRAAVSVASVLLGVSIGWVAHRGSLDGLLRYVATGWQVGSGYSSAMSLATDRWWIGAACFALFFLLLVYLVTSRGDRKSVLTLLALAFPLFAVWKHAMVRQASHVTILVGFGVIVLAIVLVDAVRVVGWRRAVAAGGLLFVPLGLAWFDAESAAGESPRPLYEMAASLVRPLDPAGARWLLVFSQVTPYRGWLARRSSEELQSRRLPESLRSVIGATPVDVYPWEVSYVPANGLHWVNRPLPASFGAYTPALDDRNAAFFRSAARPSYLVWHTDTGVESLDRRHLFWDEPRTLVSILTHYDLVGSAPGAGLLRLRATPRYGAAAVQGTGTAEWGQWVAAPEGDGVLLADVALRRSIVMWLIRAAFREDPVWLSVRFASGDVETYRVVPDNMANGLWISPLPVDTGELLAILRGGSGRRVTALRFDSGALLRRFSWPLAITWSRLTSMAPAS
jgi:hypothetical protein